MFRAYFNVKKDWPNVWSVDEGSQESEVHVSCVDFSGSGVLSAKTVALHEKPNPTSPIAWIEVHADEMVLKKGVATFRSR
jgi:hypothetical protein